MKYQNLENHDIIYTQKSKISREQSKEYMAYLLAIQPPVQLMAILLWKSSSQSSIHNAMHYFSIRREIGALQIKCGMKIGHSERTSCLH